MGDCNIFEKLCKEVKGISITLVETAKDLSLGIMLFEGLMDLNPNNLELFTLVLTDWIILLIEAFLKLFVEQLNIFIQLKLQTFKL